MSVKPDDIPQWAWEKAERAGENIYGRHERGFVMWPLISERGNPTHEIIARAIMAAVDELAAERDLLQEILDSRPAINAALPDSYIRWSQGVYSGDFARAAIRSINPKTDKTDNERPQE